jgi:hypothetical protein
MISRTQHIQRSTNAALMRIDVFGFQLRSLFGRFLQTLDRHRTQRPIDRPAPINRNKQQIDVRHGPRQRIEQGFRCVSLRECDAPLHDWIRLAACYNDPHRPIYQALQIIARQPHQFGRHVSSLYPSKSMARLRSSQGLSVSTARILFK